MTTEETTATAPPRIGPDAPLAIEARGLEKTFRIPTHRVDSLKERAVRPFSSRDYRILRALDDVSFEIRQGEFFGIVGRNGSGKSTLLKCLASIYRVDAGTIRMAGRLAPFIELGVGFNVELTARENVVLNGVMMGLTKNETKRRLDSIVDFAELDEFIDLRLKNYSSGMLVRLAFSLMMQVDADVLLIDEVLAVGDAAFQQKCADAFHDMKAKGKTIVLVTHSMDTVKTYCDRAMLIDDGDRADDRRPGRGRRPVPAAELRAPDERRRPRAASRSRPRRSGCSTSGPKARRGCAGRRSSRARGWSSGPSSRSSATCAKSSVGFLLTNVDGVGISQFGRLLDDGPGPQLVKAGSRVTVSARLDNPLVAGPLLPPLRRQPRRTRAPGPRSTSTTRSTSSSSAAASSPAGWSTSGTRSRPSSRRASGA